MSVETCSTGSARETHSHDRKASNQHHQGPWWKVMCLTGVDYFSTLGYQPSIAIVAAGVLAPLATVVLVLLTLFGALPIYTRVAQRSFRGQGSIAMLEQLLPGWWAKLLVLGLIGFCATDFIITITLSSADAAAHIVKNPFMGQVLSSQLVVTLLLILALGATFLKGFKEVLGLAMVLVITYLGLNAVIIGAGVVHLIAHPQMVGDWMNLVTVEHNGITGAILAAALVFPRLALGLSGFETGVAVMPQVSGDASDTEEEPIGRIANTRKLLRWSAFIMGAFLISSSLVTTCLIPAELVKHGGPADGCALSYLGHQLLGHAFGTVYDFSTVFILWFAGASAMVGLINLVPRYLPRYGMAPEWSKATKLLVIFFTAVSLVVTLIFNADVEAQGGAYATGVLVLMTSAALAVCLAAKGKLAKSFFALVTLLFVYTTLTNVIERPDGLKVAAFFIASVLAISIISRWRRSFELRHENIYIDSKAKSIIEQAIEFDRDRQHSHHHGEVPDPVYAQLRFLAHRPGGDTTAKMRDMQLLHGISQENVVLLEVTVTEPSEFAGKRLHVTGRRDVAGHCILSCASAAAPNAIAHLMLTIQDLYAEENVHCHAYFGWSEKSPLAAAVEFMLFGEGEVASIAREILRRAEPNVELRPRVHVG